MDIKRDYTARNLGSGNRTVKGIVLHDTAGSGKINDVKYLANPGDGRVVSVEFCVTRDGNIYQLSPDLKEIGRFTPGARRGLKDMSIRRRTRTLSALRSCRKRICRSRRFTRKRRSNRWLSFAPICAKNST